MQYNIKHKTRGSNEVAQYFRHLGNKIFSLFDSKEVEQERVLEGVWRSENNV